jgi:hypothetical protein
LIVGNAQKTLFKQWKTKQRNTLQFFFKV